jgi:hypothetical protein
VPAFGDLVVIDEVVSSSSSRPVGIGLLAVRLGFGPGAWIFSGHAFTADIGVFAVEVLGCAVPMLLSPPVWSSFLLSEFMGSLPYPVLSIGGSATPQIVF